jgi:uncharacterized surface protein with fasciclin (FAS1) repeats
MIRKSFLAAAAAVVVSVGLAVAPQVEAKPKSTGPNIVDVAIALNTSGPFAGQFDTLIAAVLAADPAVLQRLTAKRQSTVFAPVDSAFAALGITPDNVESLDEGFLTQVLLYHVVNGRRDSNDVLASDQLRTLQRGFLQQASGVLTDNLGRTANIGAGVGAVDVSASNGIIHAIDAVVLPFAP